MDITPAPNKKLINIISDIVVLPLDNTNETNCTSTTTQTNDVEFAVSEKENIPEEPTMFKNLFFDLPILKRKNDPEDERPQKRSKVEEEDDTKIFNYLTGTYEAVQENFQDDIKEESILIEEHDLIQEEPKYLSIQEQEIKKNDSPDQKRVVVVQGLSEDHTEALNNVILAKSILEGTKFINNSVLSCNVLSDDEKPQPASSSILESLLKGNYFKKKVNSNHNYLSSSATPTLKTGSHKCQSCSYTTEIKSDLISHIYNEHLKEDYVLKLKCKYCAFEAEAESELKKHERSHVVNKKNDSDCTIDSSDPDYTIETSECTSDDSYDSEESLELTRSKQYICPKCWYTTKFSKHFMRHKKSCPQLNLEQTTTAGSNLRNAKSTISIKCFECNYFFQTNEQLKRHAAIVHSGSSFACDLHASNDQAYICSKCNYATILSEQIKNKSQEVVSLSDATENNSIMCDRNNSFGDRILVSKKTSVCFMCFHCNIFFPTNDELKRHLVLIHPTNSYKCKNYECSKCYYAAMWVTNKNTSGPRKCLECNIFFHSNEALRCHEAIVHSGSSFNCNLHPTNDRFDTCSKCKYAKELKANQTQKKQVKNDSQEVICLSDTEEDFLPPTTIVVGEDSEQQPQNKIIEQESGNNAFPFELQCFDCSYSITNNPTEFRTHAMKHIDSEFCCMDHATESREKNCQKCYYEHVLVVNETNAGEGQGDLYCFCCKFKADKKRLLKYHCMKHYEENFKCDEHNDADISMADCKKCIFEGAMNYTKKHLFVCDNCNFKTFLYFCFERHKNDCNLTYKCFDCKIQAENCSTFSDISDLRQHVLVHHPVSSFVCERHVTKQSQPSCCECVYWNVVKEVLGDNYTQLACWLCQGKPFPHLNKLKDHIKKFHWKGAFTCIKHIEKIRNCSKCNYEIIISEWRKNPNITFKCFDCNYLSSHFGNFRTHVSSRHSESKFKCQQHQETVNSCEECSYAILVSDTPNRFSRCHVCVNSEGFSVQKLRHHIITYHKNCSFMCPRHLKGGINCSMCLFQSYARGITYKKYQCFDCSYNTSQLSNLRKHISSAHEFSKFKCDKHQTDDIDCPLCIYANSIVDVRNWRCYACPSVELFFELRDLKAHIYIEHNKCVFVCPKHDSKSDVCGMCYFQKLVMSMFKYSCYDCDIKTLHNRQALINHIKEMHGKSNFTCRFHPLTPEVGSCSRCDYETLTQQIIGTNEKNTEICSNKILTTYKCFDCDCTEFNVDFIKAHIYMKHMDSTFMCTKHNLGEIDNMCQECAYESLVLLVKEK